MNAAEPISLQKWEKLLAYIILAFTPLVISISTYDSYLLPKTVWLMLCAALWIMLISYQPWRSALVQSALSKPLLALFLISLASTVLHYRTPIQIRALLNLAMFISLYYGFLRFWRLGGSPVQAARILLPAACLIALYGLLQDYGVDFAASSGGVRDWRAKVISTLGNPNFLAGYLAILLPVAIGLGLRKKCSLIEFAAAGAAVLLIAACQTVTFCVGAVTGQIVALTITLITAFALFGGIRLPWMRLLALGGIIAFAIGWYMLENPYNSHGRSLYRQAWESSHWWSGMGARRFNWRTTRIMINENPLTGIGFGNYLTVHEYYQGINYKQQWRAHDRDYVVAVDQPHFQWLETAAECGPLGVLALGWLAAAWIRAASRRLRRPEHPWFAWAAYAGVWTAVIHSFSSFPFHLPASTLLVVALGSYLTASSRCSDEGGESGSSSILLKVFGTILAIALCFHALLQYRGNQHLRQGFESVGMEAIYHLDRSRTLDPWSHQTHFLLGINYARQGWNQEAIKSFQQAIRLQEDIQSHKWLAEIYRRQGNREAAIRELERIIEINPVYPGHYRDLIDYLGESADPQRIQELNDLADQLDQQLQIQKQD
ncbi:MAG: tetratricopeptide repeat protein [Candidatus Omnitrophica bacterium]|nr:tetratricopeptide repeat protein [Candidatus Omnitrophota bacterium]